MSSKFIYLTLQVFFIIHFFGQIIKTTVSQMDKRPIGYIPGKGNPLDKKVPKSNLYKNIGSTLQTGKTIRDVEVISNHTIARRKGELFKRIKTSTLFNLLNQETVHESIYDLKSQTENQGFFEEQKIGQKPPLPKAYYQQTEDNQSVMSHASRNTQHSEVSKVSALTYATEQLGITDQTAFLLLDLRDPEDFDLYHIKESINFPAPSLSRDKLIPPLYRFKNQEGKLIIIYHQDEKHGMPTANLFAEKGFDNVFLLSGGITFLGNPGIEQFLQNYPELVEGKRVPILPKIESTQTKILKRSNYREVNDKQSVNFVRNPETASRMADQRSIKDTVSQVSQASKATKRSKLTRHSSQPR